MKRIGIVYGILAITLIAIAAVLIESSKKPGAFEFVRKGESLIEKGRYREAAVNFRKAYDLAPSNKEIREYLVYGYTMYADSLEKSGSLDKAISLLEELNADFKNINVVENLAYYFCKKGTENLLNNHLSDGLNDINKGTDLAMQYNRTRKNLSNYLYNTALEAFYKGDHNTIILCLKASYALWARHESLDLLGDLYYREANPETALFYWKKALALYPDDAKIAEKSAAAEKDIAAKADMKYLDLEHFDIALYREYEADILKLKEMLVKIYRDTGADFNYYPEKDVKIIFYSLEDFREIFKQSEAVQGFYDGNIRLPVNFKADDVQLAALIAHEYTHAVVSILTDKKCPVWLTEALACFEFSRYLPMNIAELTLYIGNGGKIDVRSVDKGFFAMNEPMTVQLSYQAAYTLAAFMIDKWGWDSIRSILKRIKEGRHYSNAIDEEYYISMTTFENLWKEYLSSKLGNAA